jgi:Domain of unknown function (DUF6457)
MEWLDELAETLEVPALTDAEAEALLVVSREVAHGVERKATPLAAFLLGRAVERRGGEHAFTKALGMLRGEIS